MEWTPDAEAAVNKVPFFVRKKVRARVEKEAREAGKTRIVVADVRATRNRYLAGMGEEVKGYQLDTCFGPGGCSNRANRTEALLENLETLLKKEDLLGFLKTQVAGNLKFHHEFRITLAECPNACSQPQIKDIGIIGAAVPGITEEGCTACGACTDACKEDAIILNEAGGLTVIDPIRCLACGRCIPVCPSGTLVTAQMGFRVQLGGKLGRHPKLARELAQIYSAETVVDIVRACINYYKQNSRGGQRFAEIFRDADFDALVKRFEK